MSDKNTFLSYWERETYFSHIDVAVIGSGIVGLNAAWVLKKKNPNLKILVLESGIIPHGASTRNAGFACIGSVSEILDDLKTHTEDETLQIIEKRWKGLQRLRKNLGDANIGYEESGGYELFTDKDTLLFNQCEEKISHLNQLLSPIIDSYNTYKIADHKNETFGFHQISHIIKNRSEGLIDTGMMMQTLLKKTQLENVCIVSGIEVESFHETNNDVEIITNKGFGFKTKKLLIATNGFAKKLIPEIDVNPARAQVLVTSPIAGLKLKGGFHYDKGFYYFRNIGQRILLGGGRNMDFIGEETTEMNITEAIQNKLEQMLRDIIIPPNEFKIDMRWSGIMGMGGKKKPIIKQLSKNMYCAIRMGGMGVAIGSLVGEEAAELILQDL